jgi:hypothetical protein
MQRLGGAGDDRHRGHHDSAAAAAAASSRGASCDGVHLRLLPRSFQMQGGGSARRRRSTLNAAFGGGRHLDSPRPLSTRRDENIGKAAGAVDRREVRTREWKAQVGCTSVPAERSCHLLIQKTTHQLRSRLQGRTETVLRTA